MEKICKLSNSRNARERPVPGLIAIQKKPNIIRDPVTSAHLIYNQCSKSAPMGFDIISRLRQLLNLNPSGSQQPIAFENNRKRRSEDSRELTRSQPFKYRKVDNRFPKYIATTSGENTVDILPSTSVKLLNKAATNSDLPVMALSHPVNSVAKSNFRESIFVAPDVTRILIKNSNDSIIELPDYDEFEELPVLKDYKSKKFETKSGTNAGNVPIMQRVKPNLKSTNPKTIMQNNALRVPEKHNGYMITGRNSIHKNVSSNNSTLGPSRILNGLEYVSNASLPSSVHSILVQEKATEERLKYQQLLQKITPNLCGNVNESTSQNFIPINRNKARLPNTQTTKPSVVNALSSIDRCTNRWQLRGRSLLQSLNLHDDEIEDNVIIGEGYMRTFKKEEKANIPSYVIDDDEDHNEANESKDCKGEDHRPLLKLQNDKELNKMSKKSYKSTVLPQVAKVNSFKEHVECIPSFKDDWLKNFEAKWALHKFNRRVQCNEAAIVSDKLNAERKATENELLVKLSNFKIIDADLLGVDDSSGPIPESEFVELTADQRTRINSVICGPPDQVLVSKFNLNITRRDIHTLCGHNWLNDEIINFYMNLLTERGDRKHESHGMPKVYAMNTFFIPRLMQAGYASVKRWTRKVDIFTKDIIPVPVHVGGVHWCMAIIHIKQNSIKYYDSMGTPNPSVLRALEQYLKDESLDKHKQTFDTSGFIIESVADVPRQTNGSDCGVFSCMFAEYITRNRQITFTQQNMEFFRQKMILEIIQGELVQ